MPDGSDLVGLVGLQAMQRVSVLVGEHCDGARTQLECCAESANSDLAAVGYQNFLEH